MKTDTLDSDSPLRIQIPENFFPPGTPPTNQYRLLRKLLYQDLVEAAAFPEFMESAVLNEIAEEKGLDPQLVRAMYEDLGPVPKFIRNFWARQLDPTAKAPSTIAPLISIIQSGIGSSRHHRHLACILLNAVKNSEVGILADVLRLTKRKKPSDTEHWPAVLQLYMAFICYIIEHDRLPKSGQLKSYIENNVLDHESYAKIDTENWPRMVKRAGLSPIFRLASKKKAATKRWFSLDFCEFLTKVP